MVEYENILVKNRIALREARHCCPFEPPTVMWVTHRRWCRWW